jgi:predicted amidohydrolase YtcJ
MKTHMTLFAGIVCCMTLFINSSQLWAADAAEFILYNGKVITVDTQDHVYQAVAIAAGKVLQAGDNATILALAGPQCKMIDLNGKTVTPGLVDSHYHMMYYGAQFWPGYLNIRHPLATSKAELLQLVGDYAANLDSGEWVSGNQGFHLQADEWVDRWDLDAVSPDNPVYLRQGSGQYAVVNSRALEIAHIDSNTANPHSSVIARDSLGQPTGILSHYPAENLVAQYATGYGDRTEEQKMEDIDRGQELCLQAGYTTVEDVILGSPKDNKLYKNYADEGKLKVRLYTMIYVNTEEQALTYAQQYYDQRDSTQYDRFKFGGWKLAMDGGPAAKTVLMYDKSMLAASLAYPYFPQDELNRIVQILHDTGLQVAVHVSGDEGIDMTLTAFEQAMANNPRPDPRHRIEHGLFPSTSALQRMKNSNIILSTQPQWIAWHGDSYAQSMNAEAINHLLPLKSLLDMGVHIAFGCDVPASIYQEPKWAFYGACTRRTQSGVILNPEQKLTIQEALRIHTMGSAYAACQDSTIGSLEPGKYADLVIWSQDVYALQPSNVSTLEAELTMVNGEIVFDKGLNPVTRVVKNDNPGDSMNRPDCFQLLQNYPNPFNPATAIQFQTPVTATVEIVIYDMLGRTVRRLVNQRFNAGMHTISWDGLTDAGIRASDSVYMCRMKSDDYEASKKLVFIK